MASPSPGRSPAAGLPASRSHAAYSLVMVAYLVTGVALLPMVIGEALVNAGWVGSIYDGTLPDWLVRLASGYEILILLCAGMALFVGWIPALAICVLFWRQWRAVLPAALWLVTSASLLLSGDARTTALGTLGTMYAAAAVLVGLEWLIRNRLERRKASGGTTR